MTFSLAALGLTRTRLLIAVSGIALLTSGCLYRLPVQQGNFLEDKELNQVQVGMTRTQVRYLLGTPMVADPFQTSRWDYVYTLKQGTISKALRRHFIVYFADDKVVKFERSDETAG
jgi:outer membrane protein assembly factor BamE